MKILIVGAGAVGGYFGARLIEKGEDVTFLVREKRKQQLLEDGLVVESKHGNVSAIPQLITAADQGSFDVVLIGTKAYHLDQAIDSVKPFVHSETIIIPMLNGIAHIEQLQQAFSKEQVMGGLCFIESTVTADGIIQQTSGIHHFLFGELDGQETERLKQLEQVFSGTKGKFKASNSIMSDLWHKYLFITAMSGVTTLFQQPIGPIIELEEGQEVIKTVINEITQVMRAEGAPIAEDVEVEQYSRFIALDFGMKSSMQRDMEKGAPVEVDHLQGYLLKKAKYHKIETPVLKSVYVNVKLYEKSRS